MTAPDTFEDRLSDLLIEFGDIDPDEMIPALEAAIERLRSESDDLREIGA